MKFFEIYLFIIFPAFFVTAISLGVAIRQRVRKHHSELWERLGKPGPLQLEKFNGFLAERGFQVLADGRLTHLCLAVIWVRRAFIAAGSVWLLSVTYNRPLILGAIVLSLIITAALTRFAKSRRKRAA